MSNTCPCHSGCDANAAALGRWVGTYYVGTIIGRRAKDRRTVTGVLLLLHYFLLLPFTNNQLRTPTTNTLSRESLQAGCAPSFIKAYVGQRTVRTRPPLRLSCWPGGCLAPLLSPELALLLT
jgi:hypothetical protein